VGVEGESDSGPAIIGQSKDTSDPANDMRNTGVIGVAGNQISDIAANTSLTGVYGYSDPSSVQGFAGAGVWGDSPDFGVYGTGNVGVFGVGPVGAIGETDVSGGIGVAAISDVASALALRVIGRAEFTRSGKATIAAGKASKSISLAGCTTSTIVFALLASSRGGRWVRAVVPTTGSFTVYLNTTVASNTAVAWIAFTNPTNHSG
jgi:hypothetical protein